jgi:hypothetical protein
MGSVVHGMTTDDFGDPLFAASQQAAKDMGVAFVMRRLLEPPSDDELDEIFHERLLLKQVVHGQ